MAKLKEYRSLDEKADFFEQENINSKEELDDLFEANSPSRLSDKFIFRGVNEAKFKLYNSAQRSWLNLELGSTDAEYRDFIQTIINNGKNWQNRLLEKFFNAFGQPAYDISVLSFLQHYKAPTPLLDWTYSFDNASFFAVENYTSPNSDIDIENYFSIYQIDVESFKIKNLLKLLEKQLLWLDEIIKNKNPDLKNEQREDFHLLKYSSIQQHTIVYIPCRLPIFYCRV